MYRKIQKFFRRNFLYIVLAVALLGVSIAIGAIAVGDLLSAPKPPVTDEPQQQIIQPQPSEPDASLSPEAPAQTLRETDVSHQKDGVKWTYDSALLQENSLGTGTHTAFTPKDGGELPRMDLQRVPMEMRLLLPQELDRFAVALLQEYYVNPPKTEDISLVATYAETEYSAELHVSAHDDAPEMTAQVRLLQLGKNVWYAVTLVPTDTDAELSLALSRLLESVQIQ
ncbi:MAG: hypothetical protein IIV87_05075 [Oscillospiraceae bacterium]|nr:hypothetical protein [Oscillospiraceae bacterium]